MPESSGADRRAASNAPSNEGEDGRRLKVRPRLRTGMNFFDPSISQSTVPKGCPKRELYAFCGWPEASEAV